MPPGRVLVETGDHVGLVRSVAASTTTALSPAQEMVNPNLFVWTPKLGSLVWPCGFHRAVGRSPKFVPQPVDPGN